MHIETTLPGAQLGGEKMPLSFLKMEKSVLIFEKLP